MAVNPLSPGVYVDEISVFPPSVAPVATAVPAFIGYTEKAPSLNVPTRITTMLEYEQLFGVAFPEQFTVDVNGTVASTTVGTITATLSEFTMHYNLRMYFANGGGPCYIVSVGAYTSIVHTALITGIGVTEKADEVTLLVVPEAVASTINSAQRSAIHSAQLDLCNKMKDRFSIMDVVKDPLQTIFQDAADFRNDEVGNNNLKYGAAYYPALDTLLTRFYKDNEVDINDARTVVTGVTFGNTHNLLDVLNGVAASGVIDVVTNPTTNTSDDIRIGLTAGPVTLTAGTHFTITGGTGGEIPTALSIRNAINNHTTLMNLVSAIIDPTDASKVIVSAKIAGAAGNSLKFEDPAGVNTAVLLTAAPNSLSGGINADKTLYNTITTALQAYTMRLYPSSTMAGIFAGVDRDRGVWKAPANVSLSGVIAPSVNISSSDQENLNVDATSGKSINAIRAFAGKGVMVWGARTLAGNDNEWRYVSVRRLFIFAEESIQKASEFVVFEPNDKNTWTRVRGLISNFLTNLWRDGALAGATPKEAYFVRVGLGETMTAQDILEGKLIIQVGLAAVRPAEFIILQFSHKLQES